MNTAVSASTPSTPSARDHIDALIARQRSAQGSTGPVSLKTRLDRIDRCIRMLVDYRDPLCEALDADFDGRHRAMSLMYDVMGGISSLKYVRKQLPRWMRAERRHAGSPFSLFGARAWIEYQPKGVIGILGTWNVPVYTVISPLAYVLGAGNRAIVKPSEATPRTAAVLAEAIAACFDPAELAAVTGGPEMGEAMSATPFDHLILTGGAQIARSVMRAAAESLVPLTLELGGKSPVLVGRSAPMERTATVIAQAKSMNSGQICCSADTVYVPRELLEGFTAAVNAAYRKQYPTVAANPDITGAVNERHLQRVEGYIQEAAAAGARIEVCSDEPTAQGRRRPLRLVIDPPAGTAIRREEIFGPALVVIGYDDIDGAIAAVNAGPRPLALYYFGKDSVEERRVIEHTISGGVTINEIAMHPGAEDAPFGGIGASGMGRYHGREGFQEFSHARTIFRAGWCNPLKLFGMLPPYSDKTVRTLEKLVKKS